MKPTVHIKITFIIYHAFLEPDQVQIEALSSILEAVNICRFEATEMESDEIVLSRIANV